MSSYNRTFVDAFNRNMNCPICAVTQSVPKKVNGSAEASRQKLRLVMVEHLKTNHPGFRGEKFIKKFGGDMLDPMATQPQGPGEGRIRELISEMLDEWGPKDSPLDAAEVRKTIEEIVRKRGENNTLVIKHADNSVPVSIKRYHQSLKEVIRTANAGFKNILLVGPAGTGKTTIVIQMAKALKREFGMISFTAGVTEGTIKGRISSTGKYLPSQFATMFEKPGIFLLDEMDRADANVILILNAAFEQGRLALDDGRVLKRHSDFTIVAAGNTWGTGADWQYVGANQLDASTLSRFAGAVIEVGYDEALERELVAEDWYNLFIAVRVRCTSNKVRRVMGTREMVAGHKLLSAGYTPDETWGRITAGWTADERRKGGIPNAA